MRTTVAGLEEYTMGRELTSLRGLRRGRGETFIRLAARDVTYRYCNAMIGMKSRRYVVVHLTNCAVDMLLTCDSPCFPSVPPMLYAAADNPTGRHGGPRYLVARIRWDSRSHEVLSAYLGPVNVRTICWRSHRATQSTRIRSV